METQDVASLRPAPAYDGGVASTLGDHASAAGDPRLWLPKGFWVGGVFYNARYYDPGIGRFVSADSIVPGAGSLTLSPHDAVASGMWGKPSGGPGNPQELNRYTYALNNPVRNTDPTGHCNALSGMVDGSCYREASHIYYHARTPGERLLGGAYVFLDSGLVALGVMAAAPAVEALGAAAIARVAGTKAAETTLDDVLVPYSEGGGHHIIASANVAPATQRSGNAIVDEMLSVPNKVLADMGVQHTGRSSLTSIQQGLMRDFAASGQPNTWQAQREIAQQALEEAGVAGRTAAVWATKAYEQMVRLLPDGPPRTPYR